MMISVKQVSPKTQEAADFLTLPDKIYSKEKRMQSKTEELQQIEASHVLSGNYDFQAFLGYQGDKPIIRGALTLYPQQKLAYFGYFEALTDDIEPMLTFMDLIKDKAREAGVQSLIGPVQASFWLGYRLRLSDFDQVPFTAEPHQPAYYQSLWQAAGFVQTDHYLSNIYQLVPHGAEQTFLKKRYQRFLSKGYQISSANPRQWPQQSLQVFELLTSLYADFPAYQPISAQQFSTIFASYKQILDFSMVKLAYFEGKLVGFLICFPDYGNLLYQKLTPWRLLKILKIRRKAKRYLIMYLGVHSQHLGLGSALTYPIFEEIKKRQAQAVGALIHQGTITQSYVANRQDQQHHYGLFKLDL